jgi:hypothetical protein
MHDIYAYLEAVVHIACECPVPILGLLLRPRRRRGEVREVHIREVLVVADADKGAERGIEALLVKDRRFLHGEYTHVLM